MYEAVKQVFLLTHQMQQTREEVKDLRREMRGLASAVERLAYEVRLINEKLERVSEHEKQERTNILLQLENAMLKFERRLHPGDDESK